MTIQDRLDALSTIMRHATALAELTGSGSFAMTEAAQSKLIDIQMASCRALGLPEEMNLLSGDPTIDGITSLPDAS